MAWAVSTHFKVKQEIGLKLILKLGVIALIAIGGWQYFGAGGGGLGSGSGAEPVTITEVQKWQDENGAWHFTNKHGAPEESETIKLRSDRNIVKFAKVGTEDDAQQQTSQSSSSSSNPLDLARISTIRQGLESLQKAQGVEGLLNQRAAQQEQVLDSYK